MPPAGSAGLGLDEAGILQGIADQSAGAYRPRCKSCIDPACDGEQMPPPSDAGMTIGPLRRGAAQARGMGIAARRAGPSAAASGFMPGRFVCLGVTPMGGRAGDGVSSVSCLQSERTNQRIYTPRIVVVRAFHRRDQVLLSFVDCRKGWAR